MTATAVPAALARVRALCRTGAARRIREAADLSLSEVAAPVGVAPTTILRWERGERTPRGRAAIVYGELLDELLGPSRKGVA